MQLPQNQHMTKVTDISQFRSRKSPMVLTTRGSGALFWKEPREDATPDVLRRLPDKEMAAVLIKGMFAIYHLSREHAKLGRKVPVYLIDHARQFEKPIMPTAETLYERYFMDNLIHPGDVIPDDLYELGMGTADNASSRVHHALSLHRFLAALVDDASQAERVFARLFYASTRPRSRRILLPLLEACRQWTLDRRRPKLV